MKKIFGLLIILILGYGAIFAASRWLEKNQTVAAENAADEDLYFSARQLSLLGADFRGLLADWYWIKSLQYLGDKIVRRQETTGGAVDINDLRPLNPHLVYPMLDTAATLDPQFMTVYLYGAAVLPAIDNAQAIKLLEKGIAANPNDWRLYQNLGYIYWRAENYPKAAEIYAEGATKNGAPVWMKQMSANMQAQGGSRDFARTIYKQMFETADDEQTRNFAELRYRQIISLDERDAIRNVLQIFRQKNNRCPQTWREVLPVLMKTVPPGGDALRRNQADELLDPTGTPYVLTNQNGVCDVRLSPDSKIPQV
ncbi:MAG: tetratricopeptide repeat protein [Pyrinomonadaceae bacterium]